MTSSQIELILYEPESKELLKLLRAELDPTEFDGLPDECILEDIKHRLESRLEEDEIGDE